MQYFDDEGARREVVGLLERAEMRDGEAVLQIRRRDESVVDVPLARIRAGKVVGSR